MRKVILWVGIMLHKIKHLNYCKVYKGLIYGDTYISTWKDGIYDHNLLENMLIDRLKVNIHFDREKGYGNFSGKWY